MLLLYYIIKIDWPKRENDKTRTKNVHKNTSQGCYFAVTNMMKKLRFYNISIHRIFKNQNRFVNKCQGRILLKSRDGGRKDDLTYGVFC